MTKRQDTGKRRIAFSAVVRIALMTAVMLSCGQSRDEETALARQESERQTREDSAALKIAVLPTLDCLPLYVAESHGMFNSLGADIRLKRFAAQMDCDTALTRRHVEGAVSDIVRCEKMMRTDSMSLTYVTATDAYWQLITNRTARIKEPKQLDDKMMAMTRFSATDLLGDHVTDDARLDYDRVFRIQINDVNVRLRMVQNNMIDALWLTEPQAAAARKDKHTVVADSRDIDFRPGVIAVRTELLTDTARKKQIDILTKAYDMACDTINVYGIHAFDGLIEECCAADTGVARTLPDSLPFIHVHAPRDKDIQTANKWIERKGLTR